LLPIGRLKNQSKNEQFNPIKKNKKRVMNIENTKAQMRKGVLEFCILSVLKDKEAYTSEILDTLKNAKLLVVEGTVYPLLTRLKNDGLLNYRWEESLSGPPRKYYGLTEIGQKFLNELNGTWTELSDAVNLITIQKQ
jgi:PadR family transcriptional regulator, regulatory protein PadR